MFERALKAQNTKFGIAEDQHFNEKNKIHKIYNEQIQDLESKIKNSEEKYENCKKFLVESEILSKNSKIREERLKNRIETMQHSYKLVKRELLIVKEELRILKTHISNPNLENERSSLSKLHQKIKVKTKTIIDKELENDPLLLDVSLVIVNEQNQLLEELKQYGDN